MGAKLQGEQKSAYVQNMFGRIAERYNVMNRVMTLGQDQAWRRFVVQKAEVPAGGRVLDLATGTGDIAFEVLRAQPSAEVVGADFALPMMFVGQRETIGQQVKWLAADAMNLPLADGLFDAVVSGYLVRNVVDIRQTLREQVRVAKPGGRIVILDTTPPPNNILRPFIVAYLKYGIPLLGRLISGKQGADAYEYLPESTQAFKTPQELAALMVEVGIENVQYRTFMFGTMAVHWGRKPAR
ncbi:MAG: ubiquinone/menaquinone biosynthesis methyltransferase [Anaerolineae bacterium]|jgi:demethylmenaquinone methyltransferase/2-methoxy-6-polyprenyl-1,4-benzoquinol methylase|nr:ubiquinone/menaquinone biosynthesis methyltransferase [Anaerolineae bacterium]